MTRIILALDEPLRSRIATILTDEGATIVGLIRPGEAPDAVHDDAAALIVPAARTAVTSGVISACDRAGIRIVALGDTDARYLGRRGIISIQAEPTAAQILTAVSTAIPLVSQVESQPARITAVWGSHGAPGRTTIAIQLAVELARTGRSTALIDADTVAPAISQLLGLDDDAPGIAAACRRAELGGLDAAELSRIAASVETSGGMIDVLGGVNRPSRWPELSASRLTAALGACRDWAERIVVDVSAAYDADEEVTWDLAGPRRHAATRAVLGAADEILAVASADPVGVSRFLRDHAELRSLAEGTPVRVIVNNVRPGPLGIDARGQVRRTLERFAGIADVVFLPYDQRGADAALLHARPIADVAPRSPLVAGIRRLVSAREAPEVTADSSRGSSRAARWPRRAREAPARSPRGSDRASAS
ncbi:AAA family ATPase [Microbacterium sp. NPDC055903]